MKKLAWIASIFVALIGVSKAMDEDLSSKLTITQETSFRIVDDLTKNLVGLKDDPRALEGAKYICDQRVIALRKVAERIPWIFLH